MKEGSFETALFFCFNYKKRYLSISKKALHLSPNLQ